ncbi:hypothetical protein N0V95_008056 [Ascochyta clinopodiicola]|nr:hypothetical protein N0V95_008056 [Ascochyta clinopodiicola]
MDRRVKRKRAFSQAFQLINQAMHEEDNDQTAKRVFSYPLGSAVSHLQDPHGENEVPLDLDYKSILEPIPGTQIRHPPPAGLQYANPALYSYASLQFELYGNDPGPKLKSSTGVMPSYVAPKQQFEGPVLREAALPTPRFVRGKSMFGPSPYIRPDHDFSVDDMLESYAQPVPAIYGDADSPMSDATTAVGPLTPVALNFGDLSLNSQGNSVPSSPLRDSEQGNRATVRVLPTSSFASLFPEIKPNEVIILFDKGREARKVDKYPLCSASRIFANLLDGPFLDPHLTLCVRLRDDFPYAITTLLHFVETGNYVWDPQAFEKYPRLTTLDFNVHSYLVGSKYGVSALQDHAIHAYLSIVEHEMNLGFSALSSDCFPDALPRNLDASPTNAQNDGEVTTTPIDRFLNSLVLLWKNTQSRHDIMRTAVLEVTKRDLNKLLQLPFFVTLMTELVGFGDDIVASLGDDGFEVKAFQVPAGAATHRADIEAYYFLCLNYNHKNTTSLSDEIHLIGFSRGAFAVRALACFINDVGLVQKKFLPLFSQLYNSWRLSKRDEDLIKKQSGRGPADEDWFENLLIEFEDAEILERDVQIKSCAVWDTVSALNVPWQKGGIALSKLAQREKILVESSRLKWVGEEIPKQLRYAFQALALNEGSHEFRPLLWKGNPNEHDTTVKQCWFRGTHSDIGGGLADAGLANLSFLWMLSQYKEYCPGVEFERDVLTNIMTPMYLRWDVSKTSKSWTEIFDNSKWYLEQLEFKNNQPVTGMCSRRDMQRR